MAHPEIHIIFRNDDLCALSDAAQERQVLAVFEKYRVPQVSCVVPDITEDPHDETCGRFHRIDENQAIVDLLKGSLAQGLMEIAQHGCTHQTNVRRPGQKDVQNTAPFRGIDRDWRPYQPAHPEGYSEFNGLPEQEQKEKIMKGKGILEQVFAAGIETFVFPWDRLNETALRILAREGFRQVLCSATMVPGRIIPQLDYLVRDREIFHLPERLNDIRRHRRKILLVAAYHSWMLEDGDLESLDRLLNTLGREPDVRFLLPREIHRQCPRAGDILDLRIKASAAVARVNTVLNKKIELPRYVILDPWFYRKIMAWARFADLVFNRTGLGKALSILATGLGGGLAFALQDGVGTGQTWTWVLLFLVAGTFLAAFSFYLKTKVHLRMEKQRL